MSQTKILIMAGGQEKRWGKYLGVHKHFVQVDGEPLVHRTVRMLRERIEADINMVTFYQVYELDSVTQIAPTPLELQNAITGGTNESVKHWSADSRTIVLYGDVFFTERAMDLICEFQGSGCTFFGREKKSKKTGCPWGELFGFTLLPQDHETTIAAIEQAKEAYVTEKTKRCTGWEVYRVLQNIPIDEHKIEGGFIEINDFTEDFDFPIDYERWLKKYERSKLNVLKRVALKVFRRAG